MIVEGVKALMTVGCCGWFTVRVAEAVLPVPVSFENIGAVVLTSAPKTGGLAVVTCTENAQDEFAGSVAADSLTVLPPIPAEIIPPPHEPESPLGVATISPAGSVSDKDRLVSAAGLGFMIWKLKEVV